MSRTTVNYRGVTFDVEFDYQPYEPMVMYYSDGSGYPGCGEEAQVTYVECNGVDFTEFFTEYNDSEKMLHDIEMIILEQRSEGGDY